MKVGGSGLLAWKFPLKLVAVDLFSGSFHGNTWNFPLSVEVEACIASISYTNAFRESLLELPHIPTDFYIPTSTSITNFQLLPQDFRMDPRTSVRYTSMGISNNYEGNFHRSQITFMDASREVGEIILPWKFQW